MQEDLISRQAVLVLPRNITRNMRGEVVEESIDVDAIKALPSAPPMSYRMGYQAGYAAALREQRSCEGCKNEYVGMDFICNHCFRNVGDRYEPKEKPGSVPPGRR